MCALIFYTHDTIFVEIITAPLSFSRQPLKYISRHFIKYRDFISRFNVKFPFVGDVSADSINMNDVILFRKIRFSFSCEELLRT